MLFRSEALFLDFLCHSDANIHNKQLANAKNVAQLINVNLNTAALNSKFNENVTEFMLQQLNLGKTPSACTHCNPKFKWKNILEFADQKNCELIATGHYVRKIFHNNKFFIKRGVDDTKDQSYFLWNLSQNDIKRTVFPLGNMRKSDVRKLLTDNNLHEIAQTKESMSLCFVPNDSNYNDFVIENLNPQKGEILDTTGIIVGYHNGYQLYTAAQKKGLEILPEFTQYNYRVVRTIPSQNIVVVSKEPNQLLYHKVNISDFSCVDLDELTQSNNVRLQVRGLGRNPNGYAKIEVVGNIQNRQIIAHIEDPAWAIAPGQSAVFYSDDNRVLGGGIITL